VLTALTMLTALTALPMSNVDESPLISNIYNPGALHSSRLGRQIVRQ
jgi:hypothetical protein